MSGMLTEEEFLAHAGKKGMKWGVRKDERSAPQTKAEKKLQKKKDTRNAALIVGGSAAALAGGAYAVNRATNGMLLSKVPSRVLQKGAAATTKTLLNVSNWKFVGGLNPATIAATIGKEFIYNYMQTP